MADSYNVNLAPALPYLIDMLRNAKGNAQNEQYLSGQDVEGSWFVDPKRTLEMQEKVLDQRQQNEALPFLQRLAEVKDAGMDPEAEWQQAAADELKELQAYNAGKAPGNKYVAAGGQQAYQGLQGAISIADVAEKLQRGDFVPGMSIAKVLDQKEGGTALDRLRELAKQNDEMRRTRGTQGWVNAAAGITDNPKLKALLEAGQYGVTPDQIKTMAGVLGVDPVTLTTVEAGDAAGNDVKYVFNPRTGQTEGVVGKPQQAGRNATRISTVVNAGDRKGIDTLMGQLPQLQTDAMQANASNTTIDKMLGLIDKGAAGPQGYARSVLAPSLGMMGVKTQGLTDSQLYQTYANTLAGSLRMQIVGPGQVSNYEQELLKKVSGGGPIASEAARELLTHYKNVNAQKVQRYRSTVNAIGSVAPETQAVLQKMDVGIDQPPPPPKRVQTNAAPKASELPEGAIVTNNQTGKRMRVVKGRFVEVR